MSCDACSIREISMDLCAQAIEAQFEQHSTGLMADFVSYNVSAGRYEPVDGQVRHFESFETVFGAGVYAPICLCQVALGEVVSSSSYLGIVFCICLLWRTDLLFFGPVQ